MTSDHDDREHHEGNCAEALHELYEFLDGELTEQRRADISEHLTDCSPCLETFDFEAELKLVISQKCRDEVPEALKARIANALRIDGRDAMDHIGSADGPEPQPQP